MLLPVQEHGTIPSQVNPLQQTIVLLVDSLCVPHHIASQSAHGTGLLALVHLSDSALRRFTGWEIKPVNASIYWADVPMEQKPKMHYYNVPCDIDPESPFNPLNIVKKIYRCASCTAGPGTGMICASLQMPTVMQCRSGRPSNRLLLH